MSSNVLSWRCYFAVVVSAAAAIVVWSCSSIAIDGVFTSGPPLTSSLYW
jgi:hypothetical protein